MSDAMAVLHKLQTGLDVNVKFTGVRVFEYTPECIVFDLLDIPLYHGWLVDPQVRSKLPDGLPLAGMCFTTLPRHDGWLADELSSLLFAAAISRY